MTHAAIVSANATGLKFWEVGASLEPKAETSILIPAAAYEALTDARVAASINVHSRAWSAAPDVSKNDRM
jgi:hypothetical protein